MYRYQILSHHWYQDLVWVLLQVANDLCDSLDVSLYDLGVSLYSEGSVSHRLQDLLFISVVLDARHERVLRHLSVKPV